MQYLKLGNFLFYFLFVSIQVVLSRYVRQTQLATEGRRWSVGRLVAMVSMFAILRRRNCVHRAVLQQTAVCIVHYSEKGLGSTHKAKNKSRKSKGRNITSAKQTKRPKINWKLEKKNQIFCPIDFGAFDFRPHMFGLMIFHLSYVTLRILVSSM